MTIGLSSSLRTARLELVRDGIDHGGDEYWAGHLIVYSGTRPDTGQPIDEYENIELLNIPLPYPCGTIDDNVLTFSPIDSVLGLSTGTASWARIVDADEEFVMDLSVSTESGNGEVKLSTLSIIEDAEIDILEASLTEGNP